MYYIFTTHPSGDYELVDAGNGEKLERYGKYLLRRPDPQALWKPKLSADTWTHADGIFVHAGASGNWKPSPNVPDTWSLRMGDLTFVIRPSAFKHTGIFPEHEKQWHWIRDMIRNAKRPIKVLNLFGYTGGATLSCAKEGAEVCHVDASKGAIMWAKENAQASGLEKAPIRWIVDDARDFVRREIKRGEQYDAVIMDPPSFGRGSKGQVWKIEDDLPVLLGLVKQVLSENPLFVILNGYAAGYSPISYINALTTIFPGKTVDGGELTIADRENRLLPAGIFARVNFLEKSQNPSILVKS